MSDVSMRSGGHQGRDLEEGEGQSRQKKKLFWAGWR